MRKVQSRPKAAPQAPAQVDMNACAGPTVMRRFVGEAGLTRNQIISSLIKSTHGALHEYFPTTAYAAVKDPEFLAHLIAWNAVKGQVRDSKIALPLISLAIWEFPDELTANSYAHLMRLGPRELLRAVEFWRNPGWKGKAPRGRALYRMVEVYLRRLESGNNHRFEAVALQHRHTLRRLYTMLHIKPSNQANFEIVQRKYEMGSVFADLKILPTLPAQLAAGVIINRRIPWLVAQGAMGKRMQEPDVLMALIGRMSPTELVTNSKLLEKLGVMKNPITRAAYEEGLVKAASSGNANTLKTSQAVAAVSSEKLKEKLGAVQEKQLDKMAGIDGNWLVLGDKSGSMSHAIETARQIAAIIARSVKGRVHLVFFDTMPVYYDVTGKTLEEITALTRFVNAAGGTSVGCGMAYADRRGFDVDGVAIISDGGENGVPLFSRAYMDYCKKYDRNPPIYLYRVDGEHDVLSRRLEADSIDYQRFDLDKGPVDYYSLPNLVQTMRTSRYGLVDEIMDTPLLYMAPSIGAVEE